MNMRGARKGRRTNLYRMEGNAGDGCYSLAHETLVIFDGAERVAGVVEDTHRLLH